MENKQENRMPVPERAKQFMPFSALRGLEEALEKVEAEESRKAEKAAGASLPALSAPAYFQ